MGLSPRKMTEPGCVLRDLRKKVKNKELECWRRTGCKEKRVLDACIIHELFHFLMSCDSLLGGFMLIFNACLRLVSSFMTRAHGHCVSFFYQQNSAYFSCYPGSLMV